jgi:hypothetical protein
MARLELPKKSKDTRDLVDAIDMEMAQADQEAMVNVVSWKILDAYLNGARRFKIIDRLSGNLSIALENAKGELSFRYEEVVSQYLTEVGRYLKMDVFPAAGMVGEGLGAMRDAAIAHAVLGGLGSKLPLDLVKRRTIIPFLKYGTVGLVHSETGREDHPDMYDIVHPRQLRGLPAWVDGLENLYAIARTRWVPLEWVRKRLLDVYDITAKFDPVSEGKAEEVQWGTTPPGITTMDLQGSSAGGKVASVQMKDLVGMNISSRDQVRGSKKMKERDGRFYVPLEEICVLDDTGEDLARYIMKIGDYVPVDLDFEEAGERTILPLHIARHTDTGRFFARGFLARLVPFNNEVEKLLASLFKNMAELDMFGTLMVPGSSGIDFKRWRTGPRPRIEKWEPDPTAPTLHPIQVHPHNTGPLPAKIADFATQKQQAMANQGPYYMGETSGRVDSAAGLGFLFNTGNISMGLPANGLADAFAGVHSRMLQAARDRTGAEDMVELAVLDDAIAGVIIDPDSGQISLAQNPIPQPWKVKVDIKDRTPRDRDIRKQELLMLYERGLVDPTRFWITALEENLDFPGAPKEIWETWRKAIWQIILLFQDGKTPGSLVIGEHTQDPDIQLMPLQKFMNRIEFSLATPEVKEEFEKWKLSLENLAGRSYPSDMAPPEDLAAQELALQRRSQGGPGGQGTPVDLAGALSAGGGIGSTSGGMT